MRRFIVPAIIVVDVPDDRDQAYAEEIAAEVQANANRTEVHFCNGHHVMLDEKLPTVEVPVYSDETEIPGAYPLTTPACAKAAKNAAGD